MNYLLLILISIAVALGTIYMIFFGESIGITLGIAFIIIILISYIIIGFEIGKVLDVSQRKNDK